MKMLTVITTTYNRAYCLRQVYDSLCRQTCSDFVWLIVDDGSTDNTKDLVDKWILESKILIEYYFKNNGGMHTARNLAYEKVHTELNVIIDSDDWMTDDGVEKIVNFWKQNKSDNFAGIISNNISPNGKQIGSIMPKSVHDCTIYDFFGKYQGSGDKKLIYRSELTKLYPYPEFEGEKFFPPSYKFLLLDKRFTMLLLNDNICVVDYNEDSMTRDKFAQYRSCPKGFSYYRNEIISLSKSPKYIVRQTIHYIAESKLAGNEHYIANAHRKVYAILCFVPGCILYKYLLKTKRKY